MKLNNVFKKVFASAKSELYTKLFSILSLVASEKDYLENLTVHADAIHKHLNKVDILDFEEHLREYFTGLLKHLRKIVPWHKVTIAFDETFVPFYGKAQDNWVVGYNNKVKGATGSFKFMVCSIVVLDKRFVLSMLPMHNNSNTNKVVEELLDLVKKQFHVETVLFDRGFCNKTLCRNLEKQNLKYLILCPKWANIKKYMKSEESEIIELTKINEHKTKTPFNWRFVFVYDCCEYDWAFATNLRMSGSDLVKLYKCRWGIETNFRVMDLSDIKSKSKNIVTRCFFFLISIVLFNSWLELNKNVTFETYLDALSITSFSVEELIEKRLEAKRLLNMEITETDLLKISSFTNISTNSSLNPTWFRYGEIGVA